jgi:integrase
MKLKLTQEIVNSFTLPKGKDDDFIWDTELENFAVRARRGADGVRKSYVAQYRAHGRTRRHTLGLPATLTLAKAREAARRILAKATLGGDPQAEKRVKRMRAAQTLAAAVDQYLAAKTGLRPGTLRASKLYLTGPYFKPLHHVGISEINRADLAARFTAIACKHSEGTARSARQTISALFAWAVAEAWIDVNPVIGTRQPLRPESRDRVLSDAELAAIWRACGDDDHGRVVRLLILTGARRQEIGGMKWNELESTAGKWTLPGERSKNHRPNTLTLPLTAREIINRILRRPDRELVFGTRSPHGFVRWSALKKAIDHRIGDKVADWNLHDLRRTAATRMADIGIEPHIIEAIINHHGGHRRGVAGIYNRSRYERAIKAALERWEQYVLAWVEGDELRQPAGAKATGLLVNFPIGA